MADLQNLIKTILADTKFDPDGNLASKVYRDEPILLTASQMERYTPSKYLAMRKIARRGWPHQSSEAEIFYEQGKFMEDFEDDFDYQGDFLKYFPTYQSMNDQQLRGYFSWRTKVRGGRIEKTPLSFVFVYIYELLNQIGPRTPEEGFQTLKNFWLAYLDLAPQINGYFKIWLKDYVVYHNLAPALLADFSENTFDQAVLTLLDHRSRTADEVFSSLNSLSSYKLENSRFFKQFPEEVKGVTYDVFAAFSDHYRQKRKNLCEKFFGKIYASPYFMFKSAVFYERTLHQDYVYPVNTIHKYICKDGNWTCERFFPYGDKSRLLGDLLKTIDFHMRRKYDFKSTLKPAKATKTLETIVDKAIDNFRDKQRRAARADIQIDLSKLRSIRQASLETQGKLIIDEPGPVETPEIPTNETSGPENELVLSETEYGLLSRLLYGRSYEDYARSKGSMLSVLIEAINEKLFDRFGDTVIIEADGRPELIEDYAAELKEIIKA